MTTTTLPPARRLPVTAWGHMFGAEARMTVRDTSGLLVPIGFPTLLLVMNGVGQGGDQTLPDGSTVMNAIIMPLTVTMVVALVGVVNIPFVPGQLPQIRDPAAVGGNAVRPAMILADQMLVSLAQDSGGGGPDAGARGRVLRGHAAG